MNRIRHIGIYVSNISSMTQFYMNVFMMRNIMDSYEDYGSWIDELSANANAKLTITKLITEQGALNGYGDMIELLCLDKDVPMSQLERMFTNVGTMHVAFEVDDIYETCDRIRNNGGTVLVAPSMRDNGNYLAFAKDIEGNCIELIQHNQ